MTDYPPPSSAPAPSPAPSGPVPLWAPYYGATLPIAFTRFWRKYATFNGRASRSEYWWWALVEAIVGVILEIVYIPSLAAASGSSGMHVNAGVVIAGFLGGLWGLATIVPNIALTWRRLHDANHSGALWFLAFIPIVGGIIVLILTLLPPKPEGARFDKPTT